MAIHYPGGADINARSILKWPTQSHGAEMMRLAASMAVEAGLMICAPTHDALPLVDDLADTGTRSRMTQDQQAILDKFFCQKTDPQERCVNLGMRATRKNDFVAPMSLRITEC